MAKRQTETSQDRLERGTTQSQGMLTRRSASDMPMTTSSYPFGLLRRFASEIDNLFEDIGLGRSSLWAPSGSWSRSGLLSSGFERNWPQIDMFESNGQYVIRADVPGMKKDDIQVEVREDELTISGERKDERESQEGEFFRTERSYGRFERRIGLPEGTNPDDITCTFNNGILEIRMKAPQQQGRRGRRVEIQETGSGSHRAA